MSGTLRVLSEEEIGVIAGGSMFGAGDPNWLPPQSSFFLQGVPVVAGSSFGGVGGLSTSTFGGYAAYLGAVDAAQNALADSAYHSSATTVSGVTQVGPDTWRYDYSDGTHAYGFDYDGNGHNDLTVWSNGEITTEDAFANMQVYYAVNYSAGPVVGSTSINQSGEVFQSVGIGMPGASLEIGLVANGDLSGTGLNISQGLTVNVANSGQISMSTSPGVSLDYTWNLTQAVNNTTGSMSTVYNAYVNGLMATHVDPYMPGYQPPTVTYQVDPNASTLQQWYEYVVRGMIED